MYKNVCHIEKKSSTASHSRVYKSIIYITHYRTKKNEKRLYFIKSFCFVHRSPHRIYIYIYYGIKTAFECDPFLYQQNELFNSEIELYISLSLETIYPVSFSAICIKGT